MTDSPTGRPLARARAIDSLVNSELLDPTAMAELKHLFKDFGDRMRFEEPEQLLEYLDSLDIGACVISIVQPEHAEWVARAHSRFSRKILPAMLVDPRGGMDEIRRVVAYYERFGVRCLRIPPFRVGLPPTDRCYWPFFSKAIELDIAVSMNVGMPGPRQPGWVQNPLHVDEVAYHFPELRLIMSHCGQPWIDEVLATVLHWDNVFVSCTSVAPRYWRDDFVHFINTRGRDKMMFGTEYPTISWERARRELDERGLRPEAVGPFYAQNAKRIYKWDADLG